MAGVRAVTFDRSTIVNEFGDSTLEQQRSAVDYLHGYLSDLGATSCALEPSYIDRHHLDDFAYYYARSFSPPSGRCSRLHFFSRLDPSDLSKIVDDAFASPQAREDAQKHLQERYLGFVVKRPLPGASIGRTVLATYRGDPKRRYEVMRQYKVNICGIRLSIDGLAFQEQDGGAASCASTALWSALQKVANASGHRTPTPISVTKAASSPFPANDGLYDMQMAAALCSLGYVAEYLAPAENRDLFRAQLTSCLQSRLPVVLMMYRKHQTGAGNVTVGHAITLTGYQDSPNVVDVPMMFAGSTPVPMKAGAVSVVYAHDDNLGPHAHYELFDTAGTNDEGHGILQLRRGKLGDSEHPWWTPDEWMVSGALVPKPDKLRLPIKTLFSDILYVRQLLSAALKDVPLCYSARFAAGIDYRDVLFSIGVDMTQLAAFQRGIDLPRHVGLLSVHSNETHLVDVLIDVTEVQRDEAPSILGVVAPGVPRSSFAAGRLRQVFPASTPIITGT